MRWVLVGVMLCASCANTTHTFEQSGTTVRTLRREFNNVHLVTQGERHLLVDSGLPAQAAVLETDLAELGVDPRALSAIVVTHGHADHAGSAKHFQETYGTQVIAGAGDQAMLAAGRHEEPLCPTGWLARRRIEEDQAATYPSTEADVWVDEAPLDLRERFDLDAVVVPLPGHTEGSLVVVAGDAVFVGDLVRGAIVGGGAETHFYMCDLEDNRRDLRALLDEIAPDATRIFPGHFGPLDREDIEDYLE